MDRSELIESLTSHAAALAARGLEVHAPDVREPATDDEVSHVEARLGFPIPPTLRHVFLEITGEVRWDWRATSDDTFADPFAGIFSGGLEWSLQGLVDQHRGYQEWVEECFSNPDDPYDAVWHGKLGFASVPNGDVIAVDLHPESNGSIVYLSHDDGEGHGYVMADSLSDLLDRWVPLACPGPEDWQWLVFVPYDNGPIDPAGANGTAWRELIGLSAAPPRTAPSTPNDELFDDLLERYRASLGPSTQRLVLRALRVCSTDRADAVIDLLHTADAGIQEAAAGTLRRWRWQPAVNDLKRSLSQVRTTAGCRHSSRSGRCPAARREPPATRFAIASTPTGFTSWAQRTNDRPTLVHIEVTLQVRIHASSATTQLCEHSVRADSLYYPNFDD